MTALDELINRRFGEATTEYDDHLDLQARVELAQLRARLERAEKIEQGVKAKVEEWRKKSNNIDFHTYDYGSRAQSDTLDDCADELAALLEQP